MEDTTGGIVGSLRVMTQTDDGRRAHTELPVPPSSSSSLYTPTLDSMSDDGSQELPTGSPRRFRLPTLSRFLADFTLGFADGLTVPFALTAGLSSLGETKTVIYAGMAEICAGSISMGIGGYLAAKGEQTSSSRYQLVTYDCENGVSDPEKAPSLDRHEVMEDYLAPLQLPSDLLEAIQHHVKSHPAIMDAVRTRNAASEGGFEERACSPIMIGLSVSLGYLLGGLLPLFPYFFVTDVGNGLRWSFAVCILALFLFGFTKTYILEIGEASDSWGRVPPNWHRIRRSLWEGLQMVILGSLAALAAVLAVRAFEGWSE